MGEEHGIGFAALAKQISAWTSKCLLALLVLVAGLGFGRQVLKWWAADRSGPPASSLIASPADGLGDPRQLHTILFGDASWSLSRQSIAGDKQTAIGRLRTLCKEMLQQQVPKLELGNQTEEAAGCRFYNRSDRAGAASEEKFLTLLSGSTPVEQEPGKWRLYEFHEAFPLAVGVMRAAGTAIDQPEAGADLVRLGYRVVLWAIAVPMGTEGWTLCAFQPVVPSSEATPALADIPLPPGGRRTLSLRVAGGGGLVAFHGRYHPEECKIFYNDWFHRQTWQKAAEWQRAGAAWWARFAAADGGGSVEVHFGPDGCGGLSGLLMITPSEAK